MPRTQWPSHWFSWLQTSEQTVVRGLFSKQHTARFVELIGLQKADDLGNIGVDWAALLAAGTLQPRQWFASSITCSAMFTPSFRTDFAR